MGLKSTLQRQQNLLDEIDKNCTGLTDWEVDRVDEWLKQTDARRILTERQEGILLNIYKNKRR